jgi:hypothetical protein
LIALLKTALLLIVAVALPTLNVLHLDGVCGGHRT